MSAPRIVIAAGGTAGHVVPAIAVADALRAEGAEVSLRRRRARRGGARAGRRLPARPHPGRGDLAHATRCRPPAPSSRPAARCGAARAHPAPPAGGRGPRRRRLRRRARSASPRSLRRVPLVLTEADSHLGPHQPPAAAARRARLPRVPDRRAATASATCVTGRPVPARVADARGARAALGVGAGRAAACSSSAARSAPARSTAPRVAAFADAPIACCTSPAAATSPTSTAPGPHYDLRDYLVPFGLALAAADLAVARAGGSIFELAQYGIPAVLIPYPHATGDHQTANARWMERGRRGRRDARTRSSRRERPARRAVDAILLDRAASRAMAAASRAAGPAGRRARRRARGARSRVGARTVTRVPAQRRRSISAESDGAEEARRASAAA